MGADRAVAAEVAERRRKLSVDLREILNAIRYLARVAAGWRVLPREVGRWQTVYWWFRRFVRLLLFRTIHDVAMMIDRERPGARRLQAAACSTAKTLEAPFVAKCGFDGGKKIVGRKRHMAVDTDGRLLMVNLAMADISDSAGAQFVLAGIRKRWPWLKHPFAEGACDRTALVDKAAFLGFVVEFVRRCDPVRISPSSRGAGSSSAPSAG